MRFLKPSFFVFLIGLFVFTSPSQAVDNDHDFTFFDNQVYSSDNINIDLEGGSVIVVNREKHDEVEITGDYELYVNDEYIETDPQQKQLLQEFHTQVMDIKDEAIEVGIEGAKIGLEGAKVGLQAIGGVVKMIFTEYDDDDLDRDLERKTEIIEAKAELLEDRAEDIEDMADDLEDMLYDLEEQIPAIKALDW